MGQIPPCSQNQSANPGSLQVCPQAIIGHALRHTGASYTVEGHQRSHDTSYNTARTDLLDLVAKGLLDQVKSGMRMVFYPSPRLEQAIREGGGHDLADG